MKIWKISVVLLVISLAIYGCTNKEKRSTKINELLKSLPSNWKYQTRFSNDTLAVYMDTTTRDSSFTTNIVFVRSSNDLSLDENVKSAVEALRSKYDLFKIKGKSEITFDGKRAYLIDYIFRARNIDLGATAIVADESKGKYLTITHAGLNNSEGSYADRRAAFFDMLKSNSLLE